MLHWRKVLCHSYFVVKPISLNVQLRNAEPRCCDSARLTPLKSHSVNTTRSVRSPLRSSSRPGPREMGTADEFAIRPIHYAVGVKLASAYSLTVINASVADLRSLASMLITGT
jgi:hypothetical protein